jgi:hypothetical protein
MILLADEHPDMGVHGPRTVGDGKRAEAEMTGG